ncbi:MAG: response regulator transcription factor, partial [Clostridia bacterium]
METPSGSGDRGTILVVDDDPNVCELVALYLAQEGFRVECIHDGAEALARARSHPPDLIILDLMLPSLDGLEVCRELRKEHQTPIIMLTARGDDVDRILGLEMGADDYVPKPFNPRELTARVKAVLRRTRASEGQQAQERETLRFPGLVIDQTGRVVHVGGRGVQLTPKEFDLL